MTSPKSKLAEEIWSLTDLLRGEFKRSEFGRVILPLTILFRLKAICAEEALRAEKLYNLVEGDCNYLCLPQGLVDEISVRNFIQSLHLEIQEIFEYLNFWGTLKYLGDTYLLPNLLAKFSVLTWDSCSISSHEMGAIFETLLKVVSLEASEVQGENFTPPDVLRLVTSLIFAPDNEILSGADFLGSIYDPTVGTGGFLISALTYIETLNKEARPQVFGQEINQESYAICKSLILLRENNLPAIELGNTLSNDRFSGNKFDYMVSHPPFGVSWKNIQKSVTEESVSAEGGSRFNIGLPRISDASLLFVMHLISKMKSRDSNSSGTRIGIILPESALSSSAIGESEIRRSILERDLLDSIIALPSSIFYSTDIPTYVWILSNKKAASRRNQVHLIDAREHGQPVRRRIGSKKNYLDEADISEILKMALATKSLDKTKFVDILEFGYREVNIIIDEIESDIEKVPLGRNIDTFIANSVGKIHKSYAIDRNHIDPIDHGVGRVIYSSTFDKIFGSTVSADTHLQFRNYFILQKQSDTWDVAISKTGQVFFDNQELPSKSSQPVWKFKMAESAAVDLAFVRAFFESENGKDWILNIKVRGRAVSTINEYDLLRASFPLPAMEQQRNLVSLIQDTEELLKRVTSFKNDLWKREVGPYVLEKYNLPSNVNVRDKLASICPYPLSNILHHYNNISDEDHKNRQELLLKFFESAAIFICAALIGAAQDKVGVSDIDVFLRKQRRFFPNPSFGTWTTLLSGIETVVSGAVFGDTFIKNAIDENLIRILSRVKDIRNKTTGHGSFPTKHAAKRSLAEVEKIFDQFLPYVFQIFESYKLIRPIHSTWNGDVYNHFVDDFSGLGSYPFSKDYFTSKNPLIQNKLYLISNEETEVIALFPFVKLLEILPDSGLEAFYFYGGKLNSDDPSREKYHYISHQQIQEQSGFVHDAELDRIFFAP